jgi:transposase
MGKWETFPILKEDIVGARLAGASVAKTAKSLRVSRATVCKVMSTYTNRWKTTSVKRNSGRKSNLTERDVRIVSKNQTTAATQVAVELKIHPEYPVCTKTV